MIALNHIILRIFFRIVYWYISIIDKKGEVLFMNYGYADSGFKLDLDPTDEKNRYAIQLYHLAASRITVLGKNILEVGSGRGGGLNYLCKTFNPASATGIDLNEQAIRFCTRYYRDQRLKYMVSDAEHLLFKDQTFDVIFNIESSHGYPHMDKFLSEVYRVMKPGGFFAWADFRPKTELESLDKLFLKANLHVVHKSIITQPVLVALDLMKPAREEQIRNMIPWIFKGIARRFVALEGTSMYNQFSDRKFEYVLYILQK